MPTLHFKGKTFVQNHHLAVPYCQLVPDKKKSLTDKVSLHDNLIIHGDNLKALKALLPLYAGKVKCIYIDPPYNTGNENWVYNDNVNSPMMKEWLGKVVDKEDLTRHDKWLCMMTPRLKLLKELLSEDGVIFVSIDDNEQHSLRLLMDDIFGEINFLANIIWEKKFSPQNDEKFLTNSHDYIISYSKNIIYAITNQLPRNNKNDNRYLNPDNDPRGDWSSGDLTSKTKAKGHSYEIIAPSGKKFKPPTGRQWAPSHSTYQQLLKDNRIWFGENGNNVPRLKQFKSEVNQGIVPLTLWKHQDVGHNQEAKQEFNAILNNSIEFESPKPSRLIKRILQVSTQNNSIILDSYAGSGTTAHAVLALNKEDGGNRKFILVECEDYADKITAERVRRVIKGVKNAKDDNLKEGLGGTFSYFELGDPIEMEGILQGKSLPSYEELARYVFYTATGEEFDPSKIKESKNYIGSSKDYEVYLYYRPDIEYLKSTALTLDRAESLGPYKTKRRLVFAPAKYLDNDTLMEMRIDFCQLPFEIYRLKG